MPIICKDCHKKINFFEKSRFINGGSVCETCYQKNYEKDVTKNIIKDKFWLPEGRIKRSIYIWRLLYLNVISIVCFYGIGISAEGSWIALICSGIGICCIVAAIFQLVKRLHDTGRTGLWAWCIIVPVANLILLFYVIFKDGTRGKNEFGNDPKGRQLEDNEYD